MFKQQEIVININTSLPAFGGNIDSKVVEIAVMCSKFLSKGLLCNQENHVRKSTNIELYNLHPTIAN